MKRLFFLITISLTTFGCSDDNVTSKNEIVGQWKLIYLHASPWSSYIHDYSDDNILYDFNSNEILTVNGNGNSAPHADGQHNYFFGEDALSGVPGDPKVLLVKIDGSKWTYNFSKGQMTLSQMHVDGSTLTFVRK